MRKKIKVSGLPKATTTAGLIVLGVSDENKSVQADMELLRGNTAFEEWARKNPGKAYADWVVLLQEPATSAAEACDKVREVFDVFADKADVKEKERVFAESERGVSESKRVTVENNRVLVEGRRAISETARSTAESARVTVENKRATDETARASAESSRVIAEKKREADTTKCIKDTNAAKDSAKTSAERADMLSNNPQKIIDGYWWKYNEETGQYETTGILAKGNVMFAAFDINPLTGELSMETDPEYDSIGFELEDNNLIVII